jgi:hypothetical protein
MHDAFPNDIALEPLANGNRLSKLGSAAMLRFNGLFKLVSSDFRQDTTRL